MGADNRRVRHIDGLRGLAILLVLLDHIAWHSASRPADAFKPVWHLAAAAPLVWHALLEGSHGVDLFFVISGFCLAFPFIGTAGNVAPRIGVAEFLGRRAVRILPAYYGALLLFGIPRALQHYASFADLIKQGVFATYDTTSINEAFWTLAVEMRWYLLFPMLIWLWMRSRTVFYALLAALVVFGNAFANVDVLFLTLPAFMLGIVACDMFKRGVSFGPASWIACLASVALAVVLEPVRPGGKFANEAAFSQTQIAWQIAAFLLVIAVGQSGRARSAFSTPWISAVGIASYSIYLTHAPIAGGMANVLRSTSPLITGGASLLVALAIGFAYWRAVEGPLWSALSRHFAAVVRGYVQPAPLGGADGQAAVVQANFR